MGKNSVLSSNHFHVECVANSADSFKYYFWLVLKWRIYGRGIAVPFATFWCLQKQTGEFNGKEASISQVFGTWRHIWWHIDSISKSFPVKWTCLKIYVIGQREAMSSVKKLLMRLCRHWSDKITVVVSHDHTIYCSKDLCSHRWFRKLRWDVFIPSSSQLQLKLLKLKIL